jgi:hypothetical protein
LGELRSGKLFRNGIFFHPVGSNNSLGAFLRHEFRLGLRLFEDTRRLEFQPTQQPRAPLTPALCLGKPRLASRFAPFVVNSSVGAHRAEASEEVGYCGGAKGSFTKLQSEPQDALSSLARFCPRRLPKRGCCLVLAGAVPKSQQKRKT